MKYIVYFNVAKKGWGVTTLNEPWIEGSRNTALFWDGCFERITRFASVEDAKKKIESIPLSDRQIGGGSYIICPDR